jgi:hypothetical protein
MKMEEFLKLDLVTRMRIMKFYMNARKRWIAKHNENLTLEKYLDWIDFMPMDSIGKEQGED